MLNKDGSIKTTLVHDASGSRLAAGTYYYRLTNDGSEQAGMLVSAR